MKIYLDFDGTCVEHDYPRMGRCNFGCIEVIKKLQDANHEIILNTYRADLGEEALKQAQKWLNEHYWMFVDRSLRDSFELKPITQFETSKILPPPWRIWGQDTINVSNDSIYIDDIATGIPLKPTVMIKNGLMVDWEQVEQDLINSKII